MARQRGRPFRARLGANELKVGMSPGARDAMREAASGNWMYSDPENFELREALAAHHGVDIRSVVVGEGIDGLLGLTCMLFLSPGETVVTTAGAYPTFNFHVRAHGGQLCELPMDDLLREDVPALMATARDASARLIYISNPNSPVGTFWPGDALAPLLADSADGPLVVLDEAYAELADPAALMPITTDNARLIHMRTFSKGYGLAGARIGYAIGHPDVIAGFEKVRNHYGINRVGQIGAKAALADGEHLLRVRAGVAAARERLVHIARGAGLEPLVSDAAFVAMRCPEGAAYANSLLRALIERDIFVRKPTVPQLADLIRVSVGSDEELDLFETALKAARAELAT